MSLAVGFVGARLTEARHARGFTAADLAALSGVSAQSLSKYENGHQTPRHEIVGQLADALKMGREYFFRAAATADERPVFWRAKLSAQTASLDRARVRLEWFKEMVDYVGSYFDYPQLALPDIRIPDVITSDVIEDTANAVRAFWRAEHGPLPDCLERIEESGILVSRIHVHAEKVDAFSQWSDRFGLPFIVLSRDKASAARQRFDALHELGHIILHRNITASHLNIRATYKQIEKQADQFASFMLLPERDFLDELYAPTLDGMLSLKERWGVSVAAMIMRCHALGLLDDDATKRMWMNYTRRGWRKGEPFDGKIEKESPYLIRRSFEMLIEQGVQSVADIRKALPFPAEDLEEMADLEPGTLGAAIRGRSDPVFKSGATPDNVIPIFGKKS